MNSPLYVVFICHRRVMTIMYKTYGLTGYEIELMLLIGKLCDFRLDTETVGSKIRRRVTRSFECVLSDMLDKLLVRGFINDRRKAGANKQAWHYISLSDKGFEFVQRWEIELKRLIQEERDELTMSISSNTVARDIREAQEERRKKKLNKGLSQ